MVVVKEEAKATTPAGSDDGEASSGDEIKEGIPLSTNIDSLETPTTPGNGWMWSE